MTVQINANQFSLKYIPDEDRMLFCVTMSAEHEIGVLVTRRITRWLVDTLMKHAPGAQIAPEPAAEEAGAKPQGGEAKPGQDAGKESKGATEEKPRALAMPPKLVREIKLAPRETGDVGLLFNTGEQQIVLEVAANRILTVVETFLDLAGKAGWDFAGAPQRTSPPAPAQSEPQGKVLH